MKRFDPDFNFYAFGQTSAAYLSFKLPDKDIDAIAKAATILGRKKKPFKKIESLVRHKFMARFQRQVSQEELDTLSYEIQRLQDRLNDQHQARTQTYEGIVETETLSLRSRNPIQIGFGLLASIVMVGMAATVPSIAALSLLESEKFAIFTDAPELAFIFGLTPFAAILASIGWRNTLKNDYARQNYDRTILKATIAMFGVWLVVAALTAFPVTIGGQAGSIEDKMRATDEAARSGFSIGMPRAMFLLVTGALDLVAAPALHILAENFLFPKRKTGVRPDPERDFLDNKTIPATQGELAVLMERKRHARFQFEAYDHACEAAILDAALRLEARLSDVSLARSHAISDTFSGGDDPDDQI